ncbi:hypothetical protein [Kamptonema sp. UHCC 0994]|uniref:hypothetical protein n=1 Tax=Kamptonema sp. UHCC 0994 TaxID=3031329 RepID=UPI0023B8C9F9|nr:hypothetical protein [Kamptonema sp. UHCC 0994]MDF0551692.1 hypothetical protein [Kamptonema sp. UHCC 0994]
MARYGDINRAEELKAAKDKLDLWLKMSRAEKQAAFAATQAATGNKRSNVGRTTAWIQPFGAPDKFFYETWIPGSPSGDPTAKEENANTIITKVANAVKAANLAAIAEPTGANLIIEKARKIQFAKVIYSQVGGTVNGVVSRITGIPYSYKKTDSVSSSFGQGVTAPVPSEGTAQAQLRVALLAAATGNERVSFKPQGNVSIRAAAA